MKARAATTGAWGLFAVALATSGAAVVLGAQNARVLDLSRGFQARPADVVWLASWLGFPAVGAVIISRRPRNAVGWILCAIGVSVGIGVLTPTYARHALVAYPGVLPGGRVAAWLATWTANPATLIPFLVFLFPSGRVASARWRVVVQATAVGVGALIVWGAVAPGPIDGVLGQAQIDNPLGVRALEPIAPTVTTVLAVLVVGFAFASIAHALWRFQADRGIERQQIKWFAFSALLFPVTVTASVPLNPDIVPLLGEILRGQAMGSESGNWGFPVAFLLSFTGMSISIGVAILRYRLYEIDRIINRTLSYSIMTVVLGGAYVGSVVGLGQLVRPLLGGDDVVIAASTLIVAVMFQPLRRRVQRVVDRRFNRARYDAARTIEAFTARLREEIDIDALGAELKSVVGATMQPASVSLWLKEEASR